MSCKRSIFAVSFACAPLFTPLLTCSRNSARSSAVDMRYGASAVPAPVSPAKVAVGNAAKSVIVIKESKNRKRFDIDL